MKYKLRKDLSIMHNGITLYKIEALSYFNNVKTGDLGGYIEKEDNLSQKGDAWVSGNARVYGNARVFGDARVYGNTKINGINGINGNACISDNYIVNNDNTLSIGGINKENIIKKCNHEWKLYQGFTNTFEYCIHCDQKK